MGIPRFYRWLSERYPRVNQKLSANVAASGNTAGNNFEQLYGENSAIATGLGRIQNSCSSSFPCDCLYLDLNAIVHNSTHANSQGGRLKINESAKEVWLSIINYIDNLVQIAKPKKLLFLGVDGVAPRAKMNQQRARRFRAAQDRLQGSQDDMTYLSMVEQINPPVFVSPPKAPCDLISFDSNCITPGTEFMDELLQHLVHLIQRQLAINASWKHLEVILSGPDVPGEGEHKIMEFIRATRTRENWPANLCHCVQGLDADLVMLALMTHEPRFTLLREEVILDREPRYISEQREIIGTTPSFQLVHICLLREYLVMDILSSLLPSASLSSSDNLFDKSLPFTDDLDFKETFKFEWNAERVIDDFLLICCLAGNDFLPHLKFADIGQDGLDHLLSLYQKHLSLFRTSSQPDTSSQSPSSPYLLKDRGEIETSQLTDFLKLCAEFEDSRLISLFLDEDVERRPQKKKSKKPPTSTLKEIRYSYYRDKMGFDAETDPSALKALVKSYIDGLNWIMKYYFDGVPSWGWFYPYHYPPYARDVYEFLLECPQYKSVFSLGRPFTPFQQLMGVLPPASANLLPECFRSLMVSGSIAKYYPKKFDVDLEDSKVAWGGVALLPFIDAHELTAAMAVKANRVSDAVRRRDFKGVITIHVNEQCPNPSRLILPELVPRFLEMSKATTITEVFGTGGLPLLSKWNIHLSLYEMAPSFTFGLLQEGKPHLRDLRPGVKYASFQPSMLTEGPSPALTVSRLKETRISALNRRSNVVKSFYRVAKRAAICLSIHPQFSNLEDTFVQTLAHLQQRPVIRQSDLAMLLVDFSGMPTVRASWPLKTLSKVIAIWSPQIGYVTLHPRAADIPCPLLSTEEICDQKLNDNLGLRSPHWKSGDTRNPELFKATVESKYAELCRQGLHFNDRRVTLTETETSRLKEFYEGIVCTQGVSVPADFSWKDVLFEVIEHEEVRENLGGKPLMRFGTSSSHLCFWPQLEFVNGPVLSLTTTELQEMAPSLASVLKDGDWVMCSGDCVACGSIGWVSRAAFPQDPGSLVSCFPYCEDSQSRFQLQATLEQLVTPAYEERLRVLDLSRTTSIPVQVIRWLLRHVNVKVKNSFIPIDIGLNLMREARHMISGATLNLGVPGYSYVARNDYEFSSKVVDVIRQVTTYLPHLVPTLIKARKENRRSISAEELFPDLKNDLGAIQWCLKTYTKWLHIQPFFRIGSAFPGSESLSVETIQCVSEVLKAHNQREAQICPELRFIAGTQNILRELVSPVVPLKLQKYLRVGQRVVTIKCGGPLAPGSFGVVIGLYINGQSSPDSRPELVAEVLLEKETLGATDLGGRLPSDRQGIILPCRSILPVPPFLGLIKNYPTFVEEHLASQLEFDLSRPPSDQRSLKHGLTSVKTRVQLLRKP